VPLTTLRDAIATHVHDGVTVALEGFTHLIPHAAGHEIVRQGRRGLTLVRMTPDVVYDQLIGMGCARRIVFSWGGNPGVGSLHRLRDAVERGWPAPLEVEEHSHAAMAAAYAAGASGLPFGVLRGYAGTGLPAHNPRIRWVACPFTGERLAAVPALRPDVTVIHAQQADRRGNVRLWGIVGVQKEAALAARRVIATVEEVVDDFDAPGVRGPRGREPVVVLPAWTVSAVCHAPGGAHPSYAAGYSTRDNAFYAAWDEVSRDRDAFLAWMDRHVLRADAPAPPATADA
jgi:glutaconate CoA-transferase subunit A